VSLVAAAVVLTAGGFRCFRTVQHDNPKLGMISHHFRFCRLQQITCDANRDGIIDARVAVTSHDNQPRSTAFTVIEGWESADSDGIMNVHYYYSGEEPDRELILELDIDKDGHFEEQVTGDEAERRLLHLRRIPTVALLASADEVKRAREEEE